MIHMAVFFAVYALLTGPVVLVALRNRRRKVVGWYVGSTVAAFSIMAIVMGPILGCRRGDMEWLTISELTPTGSVQWGMLTMTSAGSRSYALQVPERTRAWLVPRRAGWGIDFWNAHRMMYAEGSPYQRPGNISMDAHPGERTRKELPVTLSPWGSRVALTQCYWPGGRSLPVKVKTHLDRGLIECTVASELPLDVSRMQLVLGYWRKGPKYSWGSGGKMVETDFYQMIQLNRRAGSPVRFSGSLPGQFRWRAWQMKNSAFPEGWTDRSTGLATATLPRVAWRDRALGYLVVQVNESPCMRCSEENFEPNRGTHYLIQRLSSDQLPTASEMEKLMNATPAPRR
jgi:hypothetical protein